MNIPSAWAPYMHGKCFDFALALHRLLPGSQLVAFGNPRYPDHVAVQVGANHQLVDVRGPLPIEQMLEGMNGQAQALDAGLIPVSVDDVALHMGFTARNVRLSAAVRLLAKARLAAFIDQLDLQADQDQPEHLGTSFTPRQRA